MDALAALPGLLAIALVGRVVLALLPPGPPGFHELRELPATWAASHLCGLIALGAQHAVLAILGLDPPAWMYLLPWGAVLLARWIALPGAMVPRHVPFRARASLPARILVLLLAAATLIPWLRVGAGASPDAALWLEPIAALGPGAGARAGLVLYPATFTALVVLLAYGLEGSRRSVSGRRLVLALFVLTPVVQELAASRSPGVLVAACIGGGASFAIPWLRRAERRAAALSALAFAGASLFEPGACALALAGIAGVLAFTPGPSRRTYALWSGASFAVLTALAVLARAVGEGPDRVGADASDVAERVRLLVRATLSPAWELRWLAIPPVLLILAWRVLDLPPRRKPSSIERTDRELACLCAVLGLGLLALALVRGERADLAAAATPALLPLAAVAALAAGAALVPPDASPRVREPGA